jgi:hypothetical protein
MNAFKQAFWLFVSMAYLVTLSYILYVALVSLDATSTV